MVYGVIRRHDPTDAGWESLLRYLPSAITGGRPHENDRPVLNGTVWKIRCRAPWRDVPARYGSRK